MSKITAQGKVSLEDIEFWADDIIISRTGNGKPMIHNSNRLLRSPTANDPAVATWKQEEFDTKRRLVLGVLDNVK